MPCCTHRPRLPADRLGPTRFKREPSFAQQPPASQDVMNCGRGPACGDAGTIGVRGTGRGSVVAGGAASVTGGTASGGGRALR